MSTLSDTADAEVLDWDSLMQEINNKESQDNKEREFDQWLDYALKDSVEAGHDMGKDYSQILSPPLYSGFPSVAPTDELVKPQVDTVHPMDELKSQVQALRAEWVLGYPL